MLEDYEGSRTEFMKMLAEHDGPPAYVLRAQRVEEAWESLVRRCQKERAELLDMCKTRLAQLGALVDHRWEAVQGLVRNDRYDLYLSQRFDEWQPKLRVPLEATDSLRKIRAAMKELATSFERFNRRWETYLGNLILDHVNHERSEYNNYYLVEKSAALGSDRLAEMGFEPLELCTIDDVIEAVPYLQEPKMI